MFNNIKSSILEAKKLQSFGFSYLSSAYQLREVSYVLVMMMTIKEKCFKLFLFVHVQHVNNYKYGLINVSCLLKAYVHISQT